MTHFKWLLLGAALALLAASPVVAADTPKEKAPKAEKSKTEKPTAEKDGLRGEFAMMAKECKLTEAQKADLEVKVKARKDTLAAWDKANAEKLKAAKDAAKKAKASSDKEAAKQAGRDLKALEDERAKIDADTAAATLAILTAEQKALWTSFDTYRRMMARYKKLDLSQEQTEKIREAAATAAKDLGAAPGDDKAARKARQEMEAKLRKTIEETILTAAQREALTKKAEKKPDGEKKPAESKAAK